jgi:LmbE family N-acetylglucosaminyl deacetylase
MRVLAIAPHPDDETLGCGGTLLKHRQRGDAISWLIVTRGHEPQWSKDVLAQKEKEIAAVGDAFGFANVYRADLPTVRLESVPFEEIIGKLRDAITAAKPEIVYLNHFGDVHSDHRVVFEATMSVLKPFYSGRHGVKRVVSYEILSSTDAMPANSARAFVPNVFTDISQHIDRKLEIMSLYRSEVQDYPLPRANESLRALARYRGATIGVDYAEAFMLVREVD